VCGICGIVNFNGEVVDENAIRVMMNAIRHRGPDDEGVFLDGNVGMGFVRLSIIDPTPAGHQPKVSQDGRYVLVFNGEIYNYLELRKQLEEEGVSTITKSDSEVLLNAYIHWKEACLDKFNGMFAFAIYDSQNKTTFCARDRFGVKPFYYYADKDRFIFGSEPVAILSVLDQKPKADFQRIFDYLVFNRTDHDEATFFEGITKLGHGHKLSLDSSKFTITKWYDLKKSCSTHFTSAKEYYKVFCDAVKLRMRSDVPVGLTLSGGIDSSSIASVLIKEFDRSDINTFSAIYEKNMKADESDFIDLFRGDLPNMHFLKPDAKELLMEMNEFVRAQQEPFGSTSIYASYKIMKEAKGIVKVMLNGQGADECLAGYEDFNGIYYIELFRKMKFVKLIREFFTYLIRYRSLYAFKASLYYLFPGRIQNKIRVKNKKYMEKEFVDRYASTSSVPEKIFNFKDLNEALYGHMEFKLEHLLKWDDRNTMRFGIEARNPFLDYRLVEGTLGTAPSEKIDKGYTKVLLRESMKDVLHERIRMRTDKIGFSTPEDEWFRLDVFKKFIMEILTSESFRSRQIIRPEKAIQIYKAHLTGEINASKDIWKWVNLELWMRNFID
jgi:asparagine synthase (glutamine-hydrolysing)